MLQSNNNIFFSFNDNLDLYVKRRKNRDLFSSKIVETHPIVLKLVEFGYDEVYSRRVFYYLHPEDIEEALNYMSEDNGIIQHRFIQDRRDIFSNKCYICGAHEKFHLKELDMSINKDNNDIEEINNNLIDEQEEKIIDENNSIENDINNYNNNIINTTNAYFEDKGDKSIISSKNDIRTKKVLLNTNNYKKEINHENKNIEKKPNNLMKRLIIYKKINSNKNTLEQKEEKEENLEKMECEVCSEEFIITEKNKVNSCGHAFCDGCWFDSLSVKIKENKISSLKCLDYNCKEKLDDNFIINLLNNDANLINNYIKYKLELLILNDPNKKYHVFGNEALYVEKKYDLFGEITIDLFKPEIYINKVKQLLKYILVIKLIEKNNNFFDDKVEKALIIVTNGKYLDFIKKISTAKIYTKENISDELDFSSIKDIPTKSNNLAKKFKEYNNNILDFHNKFN